MNVYLVRHTSLDVQPGVCYGQSNLSVSDSFCVEARAVKQKINEISNGSLLFFDAVFSSPLQRCKKLANYCGFNSIIDDRIMELNFGEWELKRFDEIDDPRLELWYADYLHVRATRGESFEEQYARVSDFLIDLKQQEYKNVLIFTHGGVLECAKIFSGKVNFENAFMLPEKYGDIINITI